MKFSSRTHLKPLSEAEAAKRKPPKASADALQDASHVDLGRGRPAKSIKVTNDYLRKVNEQLQAATSVVSRG